MINEVPVVFAANNAYVPYTGVALQSMINCTNKNLLYSVYVLHTGLSYYNMSRLSAMSTENVVVRFVDVTKEMQNIVIKSENHLTPETTYRILIPDLFPYYDKVLYLDSDIVVLHDVAELYNTNLDGYVVGAVAEIWIENPALSEHLAYADLGIPHDEYFGAGVLLINSALYKEMGIRDKCFEALHGNTNYTFLDQDVLNKFCNGSVLYLDVRWNYSWEYLSPNSPHANIPPNEMRIAHFYGGIKPWHMPEKLYAHYFWEVARETPFYEEIIYTGIKVRTESTINRFTNGLDAYLRNILTKSDQVLRHS